jgi:hypothetical protein
MRFFMGRVCDEFKYHLVSWSKVCTPISEGELGDVQLGSAR